MGKPTQPNPTYPNLDTISSWNVVSMPVEAVELFIKSTRMKFTVQDEDRETTAPLAFWG